MKNITIENNKVIVDGVEYVKKSEEKPNGGRRVGNKYWCVIVTGKVIAVADSDMFVDNYSWESGNYYATKEEAERAKERQLARVRFERRVKELNKGWKPVFDGKTGQHLLRCVYGSVTIDYFTISQHQPTEWYVKSKELAEQLRDECGDDFKLMMGIV